MTRSNVLNSEKRIKLYRSKLAEIEGREGAFCIFTHPETGKFIQFATQDAKPGFIADVPGHQLSDKEIARLISLRDRWGMSELGVVMGVDYFYVLNEGSAGSDLEGHDT